ncbi:sodium:solute symporter family protein [Chitinophaga pinensis]|uniref:Na+/solute symporter n=1 Tax=Chitinophaga pinensis (strain ATCC 43595 / DSM 2588 / LMG 13176 / NBRC 15968 / NCIMB 11800 / UQM 2034) TaxID=485918 RepID=A0A979G906_CHIPD|nr:sodium:solute symporter [Chitinophaga pinensis]ACU62907.1 Na+/solute symporter [Chitinophaga pinensis DSM 2588]
MSVADWIVLVVTLVGIVLYGIWKSRGQRDMQGYFLDNQSMPWYIVLLSIIGTQASAVTFLSAPGQAYTDGMRFVQYYFGLPLAMVVLCITFVPIFHKLKVFTAYEYLEQRFDLKTRTLTSALFLVQRALSTGISIYAPSIILSSLLGWNIYLTNIIMGGLLIIYTVSGGTRAVSYTQTFQLVIIFAAMFLAGWMVVHLLPADIGFKEALQVSGKMDKLNVIVTDFDWKDRYNIWSGLIGGFFLALSYFGTDQSQVGRYLTARSVTESRLGLLMNGLVKVPMQFLILLIGAMVFVFYLYFRAPVFFNQAQIKKVYNSEEGVAFKAVEDKYKQLATIKEQQVREMAAAIKTGDEQVIAAKKAALKETDVRSTATREEAIALIKKADPAADTNDTNYIFLHFVVNNLPKGLVGLLIAIIFLAAWGSIAAALNSLASTTVIDIYQRMFKKEETDAHYLSVSRWWTVFWGLFCIVVAQFASQLGSLIEAVNILGSLFYGVILGIFLVAFYCKRIGGSATFWAAIVSEIGVIVVYLLNIVSFLWLNAIGCFLVIIIAALFQLIAGKREELGIRN